MQLYKIKAKDFCCFEEFELPLYKTGLVWVTGDNKDSKAANNNGSGKSTIFKSIVWGLYAQSIDSVRGDKVIRDGAEKARVEIILKDKKEKWRIIRERKHGAPSLKIIQPNGEEFKASKKELENRIIDMVGLDYPAFKNTVLYGQNDVSRFANPRTRDSDRKETLHRILGIGILKQCHEWIRKKKHEVKKQHDELTVKIDSYKARIEEQNVEQLKESNVRYEEKRKEKIETIEARIKRFEKNIESQRKKCGEIEEIPKIDEEIEKKKREIKKLGKKIENSKKEYTKERSSIVKRFDELNDKKRSITENKAIVETRLERIDLRLKRLDGDLCPLCETPLKKGMAKKNIERIEEDKEEQKKLLKLVYVEFDHVGREEQYLRNERVELNRRSTEIENFDKDLNYKKDELRELEHKKISLSTDKKTILLGIKREEEIKQNLLDEVDRIKKETNPYKKLLKEARAKVKEYKLKKNELIQKRKGVIKELAHIEFWVHGFSNKGLPSYLLDRVMIDITDRANHYLGILSDGDISMEFSTQSEMASSKGELKDEINISWVIEGVEDSYPPSGGQLKKMEIATDLALMDLAQAQESAGVDLLALDEVLDGLDQEGVQRVLMLLREMRRDRGSIFVISHESDMFELFEKSVIVTKKDGISSLKMRA